MKKHINIYNMLVLCFLLGIACRGNQETAEEKKEEMPTFDKRGFDPLELPGDKVIVPEKYPKNGKITGQIIIVDSSESSEDTTYHLPVNIPDEIDSLNNQAYRIQIFTSKVYGEVKHAVRVAEEIFDRPVFSDYEVPYFKVRVGNFSNRERAEKYLKLVKAAGYNNAWVVMVNIEVKEAKPLYEDYILPEDIDTLYYDEPIEGDD